MKRLFALVAVCASASVVQAEAIRPLESRENRLPDVRQLEVGGRFQFMELKDQREQFESGDSNVDVLAPYARYGLTEEFSVNATLPYVMTSPDEGDNEHELGDLTLGAELIAYQDIFGYPFVMPYLDVSLPTGDAGYGYSSEDMVFTPGISIGTVTWECVKWILDGRYNINKDDENVASVGAALIWDVSKKFSVVAEGRFIEKQADEDSNTKLFLGGLVYKPTKRIQVGVHGGKEMDGSADSIVVAKVSVLF